MKWIDDEWMPETEKELRAEAERLFDFDEALERELEKGDFEFTERRERKNGI